MNSRRLAIGAAFVVAASAVVPIAATAQDPVQLTIESWRNDDLTIWQDKIIPAFEAAEPGHQGQSSPRRPPTEYNAALNSKLDAGTAGDLITCRPFDASLELFKKGQLAVLTDLPGMANFSRRRQERLDHRRRPDDLLRADGLGHPRLHLQQGRLRRARHLEVPTTEAEFFAAARQDQGRRHLHPDGDGHQRPVGSRDHGLPEHRPELLEGRGRPPGADRRAAEADRPALGRHLRRACQVEAPIWATASRRRPIRTARTCSRLGRAAIYPAGSWEISVFKSQAHSRWAPSRRRSPNAGDTCYISDHTDIAHRPQRQARATRTRPRRSSTGSARRSSPRSTPTRCRASSRCPTTRSTIEDPLAQEFVSWREKCKSTIRIDLPDPVARHAQPRERAVDASRQRDQRHPDARKPPRKQLQDGLDSWYKPAEVGRRDLRSRPPTTGGRDRAIPDSEDP